MPRIIIPWHEVLTEEILSQMAEYFLIGYFAHAVLFGLCR
ncbi:Conserved hypothetical protein [Prochlorococcus marinus str. MIT 9303]|uniref:Uncharacterized protein n=1 Tax=Prochlorococcus marinus (strain MIT 9303) TaxID=59922 RepID=A2CCQ6_PROM3|nr:Conserved hypothetical protein [Prochlorococcus marinus str. MIT 9303]